MSKSRMEKRASALRRLVTKMFLGVANSFSKVESFFTALAAGTCDPTDWVKRTQIFWDEDKSYLLQEAPLVLSGFMAWEEPIQEYLKPGGIIGVIGCGAGRDMIAFARLGYQVEGLDFSERAVAGAREFLARARVKGKVYCGDVTDFVFPGEGYDAFVFSWFTYGYIYSSARRMKALENLRPKLASDGCVILTFQPFHGEGRKMARVAHWMGRISGNPNPPVLGDGFNRALNFEHRFTREEIVRESERAGFRVTVYREARQVIAVLKKRDL